MRMSFPLLDRNRSDAGAAADEQGLAGDEATGGGGEEHDGVGDVVRGAEAFDWDGGGEGFLARAVGGDDVVEHLGFADWAGGDDVDGDAVGGGLQRPGA